MCALERTLTAIITTLLVLMITLVTLQVVNRYGLRLSIPWTEEASRIAYVLMIFIGSALAVLRGNHIVVRSVVNLLSPKVQRVLAVFANLMSAVFFLFVAYGNFVYTQVNWDSVFSTIPFLTIGHVVAAVLVSSILTAALFVYRTFYPPPETDRDNGEDPV